MRWEEASPWLEPGAARAMNEMTDISANTGIGTMARNGLGGMVSNTNAPGGGGGGGVAVSRRN